MNPQPKPITFVSEKYRAYLRTKPCLRCGWSPPSIFHHENWKDKTLKGWAKKGHDALGMPLCDICHDVKRISDEQFWRKFYLFPHDTTSQYEVMFYALKECMKYLAEFLSLNKGKKI